MQLAHFDGAGDRAGRTVDGQAHCGDRDFLEHHGTVVLGSVDITHLRRGGHDHRRGGIDARLPRSFLVLDNAVFIIEHVFAEVPHRTVVRLRVPVERDFLDTPVEERHELRFVGLYRLSIDCDGLRGGQECRLDAERQSVFTAEEHGGVQPGNREEWIGDVARVRKHRRHEVDAIALGRQWKVRAVGVWLRATAASEQGCDARERTSP